MSAKKGWRGQLLAFSALEMHALMVMGLCGGATKSAGIRPRAGSSRSNATYDGIS